jgi:hypothetical protein
LLDEACSGEPASSTRSAADANISFIAGDI